MKRFLTIFLSLIISLSSLMLISCKNSTGDTSNDNNRYPEFMLDQILLMAEFNYEEFSGINFTDSPPIYIRENLNMVYDRLIIGVSNWNIYQNMDKYECLYQSGSVFDRFVEIYDEQIKDKIDGNGFYFINTGSEFVPYAPWLPRVINIFICADNEIDNTYVNSIIGQTIDDVSYPLPEDAPWSYKMQPFLQYGYSRLRISACFAPVDSNVTSNDFNFEYCKIFNNNRWEYYVNIYVGEVCIGTCQIVDNTYTIPKEWYEWYFTTYLYRA
ncbi:MAG: hypothetical protein J6B16_03735 [Clostridia bacterium]|nr:hypothetical protein [Clostridia bacterium]